MSSWKSECLLAYALLLIKHKIRSLKIPFLYSGEHFQMLFRNERDQAFVRKTNVKRLPHPLSLSCLKLLDLKDRIRQRYFFRIFQFLSSAESEYLRSKPNFFVYAQLLSLSKLCKKLINVIFKC